MKTILYPTLEEALELHRRLIESFGGTAGVRDMGLLQSSLARPQTGYYETIFLEAAALMQSLAANHAFVDGNKRVAFAMTVIFLRMNSLRFIVDPDNGESFLINKVIKEKVILEKIAKWLETHSRQV
ncbi:MAG: type II toxin-antitoxin system death-on-curing family toxin [Oligoflexia bacterium]|nr:type II toxin-antitoxin system death-on-curing family toxin [Oligoflexia bacterium]